MCVRACVRACVWRARVPACVCVRVCQVKSKSYLLVVPEGNSGFIQLANMTGVFQNLTIAQYSF